MEPPQLALTRSRAAVPNGPTPETVAAANMRQLIQLRWIAVAGQTATILLARYGLAVPLPLFEMLGVALLLGGANLVALLALSRHRVRTGEVMLALLIDMSALTLQLYFSGGASNPFIALYLLQVVLGAILLPAPLVAILLGASVLSYALLTVRHLPLVLPDTAIADRAELLAAGRCVSFAMVASLLVLFITRITRNLSARDAHLADLRQHAAEEEGIVRMGLFASGAAHELGTPLATLAVILADWRRIPAIVRDAELHAEVQEMQGEVQRCKAIVSDILHSAGQPRHEAMQSIAARAFLDDVVSTWQQSHPSVPLDIRRKDLRAAAIAVDPALRQAIASLLDNAAEASPTGVQLAAAIEENMLAITVRDWGPGFAPDALEHFGKLYQSSKGAGHGLGLFLAANVARRLGGRLEARNFEQGAEVQLMLPLVTRDGR